MNLAENLRVLREQNDMTQEQLAERMEVSRQTVSKWESGTSYPEMEKLLALTDLFGCTMDELMKGNIRQDNRETAYIYDAHGDWVAKMAALATGLCICSVAIQALALWILPPTIGDSGLFFLLTILAGALLWVRIGMESTHFRQKYPYVEPFYTAEEKETFHNKYVASIIGSVGILIAALIVIVFMTTVIRMPEGDRSDGLQGAIFFSMVALGASRLVYISMLASKYNVEAYNADNAWENSEEGKENGRRIGKACGGIMVLVTALYVGISAATGDGWGRFWWLFAVGGILCGVAAIILNRRKN